MAAAMGGPKPVQTEAQGEGTMESPEALQVAVPKGEGAGRSPPAVWAGPPVAAAPEGMALMEGQTQVETAATTVAVGEAAASGAAEEAKVTTMAQAPAGAVQVLEIS